MPQARVFFPQNKLQSHLEPLKKKLDAVLKQKSNEEEKITELRVRPGRSRRSLRIPSPFLRLSAFHPPKKKPKTTPPNRPSAQEDAGRGPKRGEQGQKLPPTSRPAPPCGFEPSRRRRGPFAAIVGIQRDWKLFPRGIRD